VLRQEREGAGAALEGRERTGGCRELAAFWWCAQVQEEERTRHRKGRLHGEAPGHERQQEGEGGAGGARLTGWLPVGGWWRCPSDLFWDA
jgi:hypothetical protein